MTTTGQSETELQPQSAVVHLYELALAAGNVKHYKKVGQVLFRLAIPGEAIITTTGGRVEVVREEVAECL